MEKTEINVKIFLFHNNIWTVDPVKLASIFGYEQWFLASDGIGLGVAIVHDNGSDAHIDYFPLSFLNYRILDNDKKDVDEIKKGYVSEDALIEIIKTLIKKDKKEEA